MGTGDRESKLKEMSRERCLCVLVCVCVCVCVVCFVSSCFAQSCFTYPTCAISAYVCMCESVRVFSICILRECMLACVKNLE
jgi:hypothetical protein